MYTEPVIYPNPKRNNNKVLYIIIAVLAGVLLFLGGILIASKFSNKDSKEQTKEQTEITQETTAQQNEVTENTQEKEAEGDRFVPRQDQMRAEEPEKPFSPFGYSHATGQVAGSGCVLDVTISSDGTASGTTYYTAAGPSHKMLVNGNYSNGTLSLSEYNPENDIETGSYDGKFRNGVFSGKYYRFDGKTFNFSFRVK